MTINIKDDSRVLITWIAILAVIIYAFIAHRISWEMMIGYFACLGVPSLLGQKRNMDMRERSSDKAYSPTKTTYEEVTNKKESGEM